LITIQRRGKPFFGALSLLMANETGMLNQEIGTKKSFLTNCKLLLLARSIKRMKVPEMMS
jgi:hypothetical protein